MKKTFCSLLFVLALVVTLLSGCTVPRSDHTHTYSDKWSFDDTYHWRAAKCEHTSEIADKSMHQLDSGVETEPTFEQAGYITYSCTVCDYEKQLDGKAQLEHNYSDKLTHNNGATHWYACIDEGYETLTKGDETHNLVESNYDQSTGYATYECECGFSARYIRSEITAAPTVAASAVYIGQKLSDVALTGGAGSVDGSFVWSSPSTVITASAEYEVTFIPTDTEYAPVYCTVYVNATQLTLTVTVGENGTASVQGTVNVSYGADYSVTFTPNSGYTLDSITLDGALVSKANPYNLNNITQNHTVHVTFAEYVAASMPFTLTYDSGTEGAYTFENNVLTFTAISEDTVYAISGEFDGNIVIDVGDDYKFELELRGFTLSSTSTNPIMILSGDEVSVAAKKNTVNYIYDKRAAIDQNDDTLYSAAVYSFVDLELCGKGTLTVVSDNNNGIHTKDDLKVKNLTLSVTCLDNALKGNDGVKITDATTTLIATQGDCIKTTNSHINESTGNQKGAVSIYGGTHNLYAACDGIDSAYDVLIEDSENTVATLNIYTDKYSEYSEEVTAVSGATYYLRYTSTSYKFSVKYYNSDDDYAWVNVSDTYETVSSSSGGNRPGQSSTYYYYTFEKKTEYSKLAVYMYSSSQQQGQDSSYYACSDYKTVNDSSDTLALSYKSSSLSVSWTNYTTTSSGGMGGGMQEGNSDKGDYSTKGIKAANQITVNAGTLNIKSYDDAIHANNDGGTLENSSEPLGNVTINGGSITVYSNDDGVHADGTLTVTGGTLNVTNSYEGLEGAFINISGGNVSVISSDDGFNGTSTSGYAITISGGTVYVYASGDGVDSNSTTNNGAILFSGGNTVIICNSNGNSAIDSDGGYEHTGGTVVAIMTSGGMTSESTNGNTVGMTTKSSLSLSSGGYLTVTVSSANAVTVKMPCSMTAFVVYLGSSSATIASASSSSQTLDSNGVYWGN